MKGITQGDIMQAFFEKKIAPFSEQENVTIIIKHIELVSIKDGLISLVEEQIISLMLNVNCLIQGSLPAYLDALQASPEDWSKLCLPRPDYQSKLMTNVTISINNKGVSI